jgi:SAM-dependent methyltransferase
VSWYRRANARSNYAKIVLDTVPHLLADAPSALDVGAGFGALAIPLAERLERVTALEPSHAMVDGLRDEARRRGLDNITIIEAAWGAATVELHDLVVCAHVGPLLGQGSAFLHDAPALARRGVVLVRDVPDDHDKFYFNELYPLLLDRPYDRGCDYVDTLDELARFGITPTVTPIEYASDQPLETLDEACDFWMEYMGLSSDRDRATLRQFLEGRLTRDGDGWIAPLRKCAAVIHWRVDPGSRAEARARDTREVRS